MSGNVEAREAAAQLFEWFAQTQFPTDSPLYAALSRGVATDAEVLDWLAGVPRERLPPLLLLASVHYLLLRGARGALRRHFADLESNPAGPAGAYAAFRDFWAGHRQELRDLMATRRVQTNEVRRSASLLPAFHLAAADGLPLALVEVGASAGLNLLFDRYRCEYGGHGAAGDLASAVRLEVELEPPLLPPIPARAPAVASRVGIDLAPIDVRDPDAALWLRACIWPEQVHRAETLAAALVLAAASPPTLVQGDAAALLPQLVRGLPRDVLPCVFHSHVLPYMQGESRAALLADIDALGRARDLAWIACESPLVLQPEGAPPWVYDQAEVDRRLAFVLRLTRYRNGNREDRYLALTAGHGTPIRWMEAAPTPSAARG